MTILTKGFSEKKDKLVVPLVENEVAFNNPSAPDDVEAQGAPRRLIIFPVHAKRVSSSLILCLLIIALAGVSVGIIGGKILYYKYLSVSGRLPLQDSYERSQGWVKIPLENLDDDDYESTIDDDISMKVLNDVEFKKWDDDNNKDWKRILNRHFFQENFEIDTTNRYEKIDVPDFRNGRNGRFIHDFNTNFTGIIDVTGSRCFVMPLNRNNILQPSSLFDLVHKMWDGYYKVDTEVVRETMRVVTPPLSDTTDIGQYIALECQNMPIYKLEKFVGGVAKRSADPNSQIKFGQFAGKGILELNIVNLDELANYETMQQSIH